MIVNKTCAARISTQVPKCSKCGEIVVLNSETGRYYRKNDKSPKGVVEKLVPKEKKVDTSNWDPEPKTASSSSGSSSAKLVSQLQFDLEKTKLAHKNKESSKKTMEGSASNKRCAIM